MQTKLSDFEQVVLAAVWVYQDKRGEFHLEPDDEPYTRLVRLGLIQPIAVIPVGALRKNPMVTYRATSEGVKLIKRTDPVKIAQLAASAHVWSVASTFIKKLSLEELPPYLTHRDVLVRDAAELRYYILTHSAVERIKRFRRKFMKPWNREQLRCVKLFNYFKEVVKRVKEEERKKDAAHNNRKTRQS